MSDTGFKIDVFHERCMGAGNCVDAAPDYFDQSDIDGTVVVLKDVGEPGDEAKVAEAAAVCPVAALGIHR
ncbi:ferredoxin [Rhodococcoides kyotonense]|uniref:Ferredoxin n=1 Tax=Rhodococcoides kyotonense TaxID=398843 RepID=A0A239M1I4_9NOCA|nr:ferredoxin [Rhodococcus kyotonensis]SNT35958.1 ferredoxin [Rhodococcus kyotonensis]